MNGYIKNVFTFILFTATIPAYAQFFIWGESVNYEKEVGNTEFCHCYKIDGYWRQTLIHYQMVDKAHFNNKIEIENSNYYKEWQMYAIKLSVDGKDTVLVTDSDSGVCTLIFDSIPFYLKLTIFSLPNGVYVPITDYEVPSRMSILWGQPNGGHGVLTIRSKVELNQKDIEVIRQSVANGSRWAPDYYYYFISDM